MRKNLLVFLFLYAVAAGLIRPRRCSLREASRRSLR